MCIFCKKNKSIEISIDDYKVRSYVKGLVYDYLDNFMDQPRTETEISNFRILIDRLEFKIMNQQKQQNVDNVKEYIATENFIDLVVEKINKKQIR